MSKFSNYKLNNSIFFETGTWQGDGIRNALLDGYEQIYSCDIDPELIEKAKMNFSSNENVHLINDDSKNAIKQIINELDKQCLFFLDAHIMPKDPQKSMSWGERQLELNKFDINCPLIQEIEGISLSEVKTHSILIDDYQCFGTWMFNFFTFEDCKEMIMKINSNYKFQIINNSQAFFWV